MLNNTECVELVNIRKCHEGERCNCSMLPHSVESGRQARQPFQNGGPACPEAGKRASEPDNVAECLPCPRAACLEKAESASELTR